MLLDAHQEYNQLLGDDERGRDDDWFADVDTQHQQTNQRAKSSKCSGVYLTKGSMN